MIWIIILVVFLIAGITLSMNYDIHSAPIVISTVISWFMVVILFTIVSAHIGIGIDCYPELIAQKEEIISLKSNVDKIKNSRYEHKMTGKFVSGSIENFKQSTAVTDYVSALAFKEAEYNKKLSLAKTYSGTFYYKFFTWGLHVDSVVLELEKL